jgi:hypothetical protein
MDIVMARTATILEVSRRAVLALASVAPSMSTPPGAPAIPDFDLWWAEHVRVHAALAATPEAEEEARDALLDRWTRLETLILQTPGASPSAVRAKTRLLLLSMGMERHAFLPAMREIHDFVERSVLSGG